jgi:UDP-glucose 4-epimerase
VSLRYFNVAGAALPAGGPALGERREPETRSASRPAAPGDPSELIASSARAKADAWIFLRSRGPAA